MLLGLLGCGGRAGRDGMLACLGHLTIRGIDDIQLWLTICSKGHDAVADDVVIGVVAATGRVWVGSVATVMIAYANDA